MGQILPNENVVVSPKSNLRTVAPFSLAVWIVCAALASASADVVSPHINGGGRVYSTEPANTAFFGIGISGRKAEASALRFEGEQDIELGKFDEAVRKLSKAVQLDIEDPQAHILYARAITAQLYANKGPIDEGLLSRCIEEWKLIWHHDADYIEQAEARRQARRLSKIAKSLKDAKRQQEKALLAQQKHMHQ
ncbi:MAG: hypothetical protein HY711_03220 [Candidatus Melainabacteria bacterium]|nr:hypothetical protein [Candidatus Melainabacteria bacterium]